MALLSSFLQIFIVLAMYNFRNNLKKLLYLQSEHLKQLSKMSYIYFCTVWSVNNGLSGNLWKPPETSAAGFRRFPEVSGQSVIDGPHGRHFHPLKILRKIQKIYSRTIRKIMVCSKIVKN